MTKSVQALIETGELISTAAVASRFAVDVATVNRWARSGRLKPVVKAPGKNGANLFDPVVVEKFAATLEASA